MTSEARARELIVTAHLLVEMQLRINLKCTFETLIHHQKLIRPRSSQSGFTLSSKTGVSAFRPLLLPYPMYCLGNLQSPIIPSDAPARELSVARKIRPIGPEMSSDGAQTADPRRPAPF